MKHPAKQNYLLGICCLLAALLQIWFAFSLDGSEFSGGRLTGPILNLADYGGYLFLLSAVLAFFLLRVSSIMALTAALLCMPLYLYFIAPGVFRKLFPGEYSIPITSVFTWSFPALAGVGSLAVAGFVSVYFFKKRS
jgi:hypothetical protein